MQLGEVVPRPQVTAEPSLSNRKIATRASQQNARSDAISSRLEIRIGGEIFPRVVGVEVPGHLFGQHGEELTAEFSFRFVS
jgi:hypothetical protein